MTNCHKIPKCNENYGDLVTTSLIGQKTESKNQIHKKSYNP